MVIHITNGMITDGGTLLLSHLGGSKALVQVALHTIRICGLELHSICFKKCTHVMAVGYFLWYIAYNSQPGIIVLVPICSLYGNLAGAITFLYPLPTKLFTVYATGTKVLYCLCLLCQNLCFNHSMQGCR